MDNVEARLLQCFLVVFPNLNEQDLRSASIETVEDWDSVASVTLVNVIEEEFGIQIAIEDVEELISFRQLLTYMKSRNVAVS
jgi:acyl carrier protein